MLRLPPALLATAALAALASLGCVEPRTADLNRDGYVDVFDLALVASCMTHADDPRCVHADIDRDGVVDADDFAAVHENYGARLFDPETPEYTPASVHQGRDGVIYFHAPERDRIFRWSQATRRPLAPLEIGPDSQWLQYDEVHDRLYVAYEGGGITRFDASFPVREQTFASAEGVVTMLGTAGGHVVVLDRGYFGGPDTLTVFGADGRTLAVGSLGVDPPEPPRVVRYPILGRFPLPEMAWSAARNELYFVLWFFTRSTTSYALVAVGLDPETGALGEVRVSADRDVLYGPARIAPDGSRLALGTGQVLDTGTLDVEHALFRSRGPADVSWLDGLETVTLRTDGGETVLEHWDPEGRPVGRGSYPGTPIRTFPWLGGATVVTQVLGRPVVYGYREVEDADGDGVPNREDDFPVDAAASVDTDRDGAPDAWNPGRDAADSSDGLALDVFPNDPLCQLPEHRLPYDPERCDFSRGFPEFRPRDLAADAAGTVYLLDRWSETIYRWSSVLGGHLDPIAVGPDASRIAWAPAEDRLYVGYANGEIEQIALGEPGLPRTPFASVPLDEDQPYYTEEGLAALTVAGSIVVVKSAYPRDELSTFTPDGAAADSAFESDDQYVWSASDETLYSAPYYGHVAARSVDAHGSLGVRRDSSRGFYGTASPLSVSDKGTSLLVSRSILDTRTFEEIDELPLRPEEALWRGGQLFTLRDDDASGGFPRSDAARFEHRGRRLELFDERRFEGEPVGLLDVGAALVVVTQQRELTINPGRPVLTLYEPNDDVDGDGVPNGEDDLPGDPAASLDSDGDGAPDAWNPGSGPEDSTTGLVLDAFPADAECQLPEHGRPEAPELCDIGTVVPDYEPDQVVVGADGVVYLLSRQERRVFRWSAAGRHHLSPLEIGERAWRIAHAEALGRLYVVYENGDLTWLDPNAERLLEQPLEHRTHYRPGTLLALGELLVVGSYSAELRDAEGALLERRSGVGTPLAWEPGDEELVSVSSSYTLRGTAVDTEAGSFGETRRLSHSARSLTSPLRLSPAGDRALVGRSDGKSLIFDRENRAWLQLLDFLPDDALWLENGDLLTLRATVEGAGRLEHRGPQQTIYAERLFDGGPLRLLDAGGGEVVVVAQGEGRPVFAIFTPSDDVDGDGVLNADDAFPEDPAASVDSDGDGAPDAWNPDRGPEDSTTGLALDAFPQDEACQTPEHGFPDAPQVCDIANGIPDYVPDAIAVDPVGLVYLLSVERMRVYRWSLIEGIHLEPIDLRAGFEDEPRSLAAGDGHLYVGWRRGAVTRIDVSAAEPVEEPLRQLSVEPRALAAGGGRLLLSDPTELYDTAGNLLDAAYYRVEFPVVWHEGSRAFYWADRSVRRLNIDASGGFGESLGGGTYLGHQGAEPDSPLDVSPDGSRIIVGRGGGRTGLVLDGSRALVDELPVAIDDADFLPDGSLVTIRDAGDGTSVLDAWRPGDLAGADARLYPGSPLRVVAAAGQVVAVTQWDGQPRFADYLPGDDGDGDGVPFAEDAFPLDPAASVDSDRDGAPDAWNAGSGSADSTTGLALDAFPMDAACQIPEHAFPDRPEVCDAASGVPDYEPARIQVGEDGIVYLLSPEHGRIFRWSLVDDYHLTPILLSEREPQEMAYSAANRRLYLSHPRGELTQVDLDTLLEEPFVTLPEEARGLLTLGDRVLTMTRDVHRVHAADGALLASRDQFYSSRHLAWSAANQRAYMFRDGLSPNDLHAETIDPATGEIGAQQGSPYHGDFRITPPIRVSRDGSRVLLGSGDLYDGLDLELVGSLPTEPEDALWLEDGSLVTIREAPEGATVLERWSAGDRRPSDGASYPGAPLRVLAAAGEIAVVTQVEGRPRVSAYAADGDGDRDGVDFADDAFPLDPAASLDSDADGFPDAWNPGVDQDDSTTGLVRDAFPQSAACQLPEHGAAGACDPARRLPAGPVAKVQMDPAGVVYLLSVEDERIYRWSLPEAAALEPIPVGPEVLDLAYGVENDRLYLGYPSGAIRRIDPGADAPREEPFGVLPWRAQRLLATGRFLATGRARIMLSPEGDWVEFVESPAVGRNPRDWTWSGVRDRIYYLESRLAWLAVDRATGEGGESATQGYQSGLRLAPPIRVSPDGERVLDGYGSLFQATSMMKTGELPTAVEDAAWLEDGGLVTIRASGDGETLLEQWLPGDLELTASRLYPGAPQRVLRGGGAVAVVTTVAGAAVVDRYDPTDDGDGDGVPHGEDAFPLDPAASRDSDGDGFPDAWNPGAGAADSTTGLVLDAFPQDLACQTADQGLPERPETCDIGATIPSYLPAQIERDEAGIAYLLSPENRRIYRWSLPDGEHRNPIPIGGGVVRMAHAAESRRLYVAYENGLIQRIELDAPAPREAPFAAVSGEVLAIASVGDRVFAKAGSFGSSVDSLFSPEGEELSRVENRPRTRALAFGAATDRIYFLTDQFGGRLRYEAIDPASGAIGEMIDEPFFQGPARSGPLRPSPDGLRVLLGSGELHDADHLSQVDALPEVVDDALWIGTELLTVRQDELDTRVELRGPDLRSFDTLLLPGQPLRLIDFDERFWVVTRLDGRQVFTEYVPNPDPDGDGATGADDAFPFDPAASADTDGDGFPDGWNPGAGPEDSTTGLVLDAFPDDGACQLPEHGRGGVCDFAEVLPRDPETPLCDVDAPLEGPLGGFLSLGVATDLAPLCDGWVLVGEDRPPAITARNVRDGRLAARHPLSMPPGDLELDAERKLLYATLPRRDAVARVDLVSGAVTEIPLGDEPRSLALAADGTLYVLSYRYSIETLHRIGPGDDRVARSWRIEGRLLRANPVTGELLLSEGGFLRRYFVDPVRSPILLQERRPEVVVTRDAFAISPDGAFVASERLVTGLGYRIAGLLSSDLLRLGGLWDLQGRPTALTFGPESRRLLATDGRDLVVFDVESLAELQRLTTESCGSSVFELGFSRGGALGFGLKRCSNYETRIHWFAAD